MTGSQGFEQSKGESLASDLSFLTTASHELKEPLALVRQLALALEQGVDADERQRIAQQITLVSERALRLTTNLTRSSRLEDTLFMLEPINPQQICEEVAHELTPLYRAKGREIRVTSRYRPILAVANRDLLRRILLNFGDNALHYAQDVAPVEMSTTTRAHGDVIRMGVRDFGPSMTPKVWARLQRQLGSTSQPLHHRPQSSGLGLYIAGRFAEAMNGAVGASRHRNGATFYVDMRASSQLRLL